MQMSAQFVLACNIFFSSGVSHIDNCMILIYLVVWTDQVRICFSSHSTKFYLNKNVSFNITAVLVGQLTQTLRLPFMQILSVSIFSHWLQFSDNKEIKSYQPCINIPAVVNTSVVTVHAHSYTDTRDLLTDRLVWTCFLGRSRLLGHYEPWWHLIHLSLTISYHRYQHANHDPDHDPCQEAEEDEEEEADDHGNSQSPAKRRYSQFKENLFSIQTELIRKG